MRDPLDFNQFRGKEFKIQEFLPYPQGAFSNNKKVPLATLSESLDAQGEKTKHSSPNDILNKKSVHRLMRH